MEKRFVRWIFFYLYLKKKEETIFCTPIARMSMMCQHLPKNEGPCAMIRNRISKQNINNMASEVKRVAKRSSSVIPVKAPEKKKKKKGQWKVE